MREKIVRSRHTWAQSMSHAGIVEILSASINNLGSKPSGFQHRRLEVDILVRHSGPSTALRIDSSRNPVLFAPGTSRTNLDAGVRRHDEVPLSRG
jgi:hypothetical protein